MALDRGTANVRGWIEVSESATARVLRIGGELDAQSCTWIEPTVMAAIASGGSVILDLDELTFCDSRGVAMFIKADEKAKADGTAFAVRHVPRPVRRVFEIPNLDSRLDFIEYRRASDDVREETPDTSPEAFSRGCETSLGPRSGSPDAAAA